MSDKDLTQPPAGEFIMFASGDGRVRVECRFESDTIWLSQAAMAELYDKDVRTINEHLINIFSEGELVQNSTIRKFRIVRQEGKRQVSREIDHYNLEAILAVGYRVRSPRGTQFRQWATQTLQEYLIFALAADYQPSLKETTQFFQTIQNKLHFACTGHTAAELIHKRADANQPHMGLTSYKGEEVRKGDVTVAKNYLTQDEVSELNRVVNMWLDFAEDQARRRQQVFLRDWQDKLDQFLQFNDREVLQGAGKISKKMADEKAQAEYVQFAEQQRRLKEAEGEKDIAGLLQWNKESKK